MLEVFRARGIYTLASFYGVNFVCVAAFQDFEDGQMLQLVFCERNTVNEDLSRNINNLIMLSVFSPERQKEQFCD